MKIREWIQIVPELNDIIPDQDIVSQFFPIGNIIYKPLATWVGPDRPAAVKFNCTKDDINIFCGFNSFWCFSGVLIGESRYDLIGKSFCNLIYKMN